MSEAAAGHGGVCDTLGPGPGLGSGALGPGPGPRAPGGITSPTVEFGTNFAHGRGHSRSIRLLT